MNVLKIREIDQHFKVSNFFVKRQFFKLQKILKVHMRIHNNLLTNQNRSPVGMSLSGVIFNHVSSLTNEWTPPLAKTRNFRNLPS